MKNLDKESDDSFEIIFKLKTQSAFTNPSKMISTIQINIEDINDNPPKFVFNNENENNYLITIGQSTAPGSGIIQIKANDRDSGQFGKILYEITRNVDNLFTIDSETGVGKFQNYVTTSLHNSQSIITIQFQGNAFKKPVLFIIKNDLFF